jgi:hypothetical protein
MHYIKLEIIKIRKAKAPVKRRMDWSTPTEIQEKTGQ